MILCQMKTRVQIAPGTRLTVRHVASLAGPEKLLDASVPCPTTSGEWKISALSVAKAVTAAAPEENVQFLGGDTCYVHVCRKQARDSWKWLRTLAVMSILLLGSALGLCWFHSDVDMPRAQQMVYRLLTGHDAEDPRQITVPYIAGVALGVAVFYALPGRQPTLMEVKNNEYRQDMEEAEAQDVDEA